MTLVVEDGTGLYNANSFLSLADFKTYCGDRGYDISTYTDAEMEAALVRATQHLSEGYHWKGHRRKPRDYEDPTQDQALEWPRIGVVDGDGYSVPDDVIPRGIKWATAEEAFYELQNPGAFAPAHTSNNVVKTEKVGPMSVTYDTSKTSAWGARPEMVLVKDLISEFLEVGVGNPMVGKSVRM